MIFDCPSTTALVMSWQQDRSPETLLRILANSNALIEAIVSGYNPLDREDMIQEARTRIIYALPHYNHAISNLYNYFAAVIHNCCVTYNAKAWKHDCDDIESRADTCEDKYESSEILQDLVVRNRVRFPSVETSCIDGVTNVIYVSLVEGCSSRNIISKIMSECDLTRRVASVIYQSSMIYMRSRYSSYASEPEPDADEFSIMHDIRELLGVDSYIRFIGACNKLNIRVL